MAGFTLLLSGCAGSHGSSALPPATVGQSAAAHGVGPKAAAAAGTDVVAIDAGGTAAAGFSADTDYTAASTWTYQTAGAIDTSGVSPAAAQSVYQTARQGPTVVYTLPGLTPGGTYTVRLSFAELWWTAAGQRSFNVSINGSQVLSKFDIIAAAGARNKAISESFAVTATSAGSISIVLGAVTNNALINAIEVLAGPTASPTPTAAPATALAINAGGAAAGTFSADRDYAAAGTWTYASTKTVSTAGVTNAAPQLVYQSEREGPRIAYTIPGLTAGAAYTIRLDFAELWWTTAGQRIFNVSINNAGVLNNFDVAAAAGGPAKAIAESFNATAGADGSISIVLTAVKDNATLNGIELSSGTSPATPSPSPSPSPSPTAVPLNAFVDWPTYAFDSARGGFNPNTTSITPASIAGLHVGWQTAIHGATQSQPIVVTNVAGHQALLIVANFAIAQAYDALTGALVWQTTLPIQNVQDCGIGGVSGSAQYVASLGAIFMAAGNGSATPAHTILYRLNAATGTITGQVDVTPSLLPGEASHAHSGITYANGRIYLGTGSNCEGTATGQYPSWRGRVVSVDPAAMTLLSTFFTTWGQGGNYGGGGVWSWGGVSADPNGNIYVGTGNAETNAATGPQRAAPPFAQTNDDAAGLADRVVKISADLSTLEGSDLPKFAPGVGDLDYAGTPVIYAPSGCGVLSATQGKSGLLVVNNTDGLGEAGAFNLSVPNSEAYYIGNPAFSPATGYLYAAITSAGAGSSLLPPGLAAIGNCGSSIAWHAQFGPDSTAYSQGDPVPRSAPTVTAGGVVFIGTPCTANGSGGCGSPGAVNGALWAVDATTGSVLGGGKPLLITGDNIRMAPSADGLWVFVLDGSGNMYGLTVDASVKAIAAKAGRRVMSPYRPHRG